MRPFRFIAAVLLLSFSLAGCAARVKNVTNLPAGVTLQQAQDWDVAVQSLNEVAAVTTTARQSVIALNKGGLFKDGPAYVTALQVIGKIDELQLSASNVLKQSPNNFSLTAKQQVQAYVTQIGQQLVLLNQTGVTNVKNPNSQTQISDLISQITALTGLILQL
jgi:hypothetical protein